MAGRRQVGGHLVAVLQAFFVTLLWSSSWVLIKKGLGEIPPLTFAGLRYALAAALLWGLLLASRTRRGALREVPGRAWQKLVLLGIVMYTLTQGSQFLALAYLPAQTVSLSLSMTPVLVALLGTLLLAEGLRRRQWLGVGLVVVGALVYFLPGGGLSGAGGAGAVVGWAAAVLGTLANAAAALLGRSVNRGGRLDPLVVTAVSMGVGTLLLLGAGVAIQGLPAPSLEGWLIVVWLAVVNTAFAFTLWNLTLRRLSATESSIINNTMLVQIAVLAYAFLGEPLGPSQLVAFGLVVLGTVVVQLRGAPRGSRGL